MENLISFGSNHQNQAVSKSTFIVWTRDVIINVEWIQFLVVMPLPWQKCRDVLTRFENAQKVQQLRSACERLQFWKCQRTQSLKYSISMETISEKIRNQHRNVVKCNIPQKKQVMWKLHVYNFDKKSTMVCVYREASYRQGKAGRGRYMVGLFLLIFLVFINFTFFYHFCLGEFCIFLQTNKMGRR